MVDPEPGVRQHEPRRACEECNRKKTKCDMRRPVCSLCLRTGNTCTFPLKRKRPTQRKPQVKVQSQKFNDSLAKLVQVLGTATRAGNDGDTGDNRHESSQALLRDSLKDVLAELNDQENRMSNGRSQAADHLDHDSDSEEDNIEQNDRQNHEHELAQELLREPTHLRNRDPSSDFRSSADYRISGSLATDLINLFFAKVQAWVSLLHRPRFQAHYEKLFSSSENVIKDLSSDESLLLYSMFALSARFSTHSRFAGIPPNKRGFGFAQRARESYAQARPSQQPTLTYLQGCILLANYFYTSGPTHQGWILIGVCVRLAYDLGLSELDDDEWTPVLPIDHVEKEEMRRAWWAVWELDTFASTVSRNPFSIDRRRMAVALPISDEAWFAEVEISSAQLNMLPGQSWRSLQGCGNNDERAWFLVANHFLAAVFDRVHQKVYISADEKLTLENEVCCFKLALPSDMRLDAERVVFTPATFARCNWVIGIHLMLMTCSLLVSSIVTVECDDRSMSSMSSGPSIPLRQRAIDLSRIVSLWDPRYIVYTHPFLTCMMLPPYYVDGDTLKAHPLVASSHDLGKLVLSQFAERWKLGSVVSELANIVERGNALDDEERQLAKRYALFFRMPRLHGFSPGGSTGMDKNSGTIEDITTSPSIADTARRVPQAQEPLRSTNVVNFMDPASYDASMFDPQHFPQLGEEFYNGSNEMDFGFSDFFGGYGQADYMHPRSTAS